MRQLHVVPRFPVGTHTFVLWQIKGALQAGHEVHVLAGRRGNADGDRLAHELKLDRNMVIYADYRSSPILNWSPKRFVRPIREAARSHLFGRILAERRKTFFTELLRQPAVADAELIQAHFIGRAIEVGIPLAKVLGVPVVVTAHSPVDDFGLDQISYVQEHADAVVVVSDAERHRWSARTGSDQKLVRVWNGAPPAGERPTLDDGSAFRLASVCRLAPEKRVDDLIAAVGYLRDRGCACHLDIFGDGPLRGESEALIDQLDLQGRVRLRGLVPHDEVIAQLLRSHALIHAADFETFGLVLIEAMSAGLPVIAARSSGAGDIVIDGETGFLVPCRDPMAIADRIAQLADDRESALHLGRAGRQRFEREFSIAAHMRNMERVWARVREHRPAGVS